MRNSQIKEKYDVIIAGAGPAGCACALSLRQSGLSVAVFDKAEFPRDKVCGDAIPGRALKVLADIDPAYAMRFRKFTPKYLTSETVVYYRGKSLRKRWVREAYTCTRMEFDGLLFSLLAEDTGTDVFPGMPLERVEVLPDGVRVRVGGRDVHAEVVVGADGAHSVVARQLTGTSIDRHHHVASVRAYYANVGETRPEQTEVFLDKRFFPGYFWLFPLPGNRVNAGFGMLSDEVARRRINVRDAFGQFLLSHSALRDRFAGAERIGELQGFGLPLGSRRIPLSGNRFLLTGDAASLIDPVSGDGIGNAMLSGMLAARQLRENFNLHDFSPAALARYDAAVYKALGRELRTNTLVLRLGTSLPFLLDLAFLGR